MRNRERFADRAKRDERARELQMQGFEVHRYHSHNQQMHPMYLKDLKDTLEGQDTGFGNAVYKTTFSVIYTVAWHIGD